MATVVEPANNWTGTSDTLVSSVVDSVTDAFMMCGTSAKCVGIASVPMPEKGLVTGVIGVHGKVSGFITVNMAERVAITAVEGLLQDSFGKITTQVVDGAGEITNIIVGGIKSRLGKTPWAFQGITVPSVIVGEGYQMAFAKGLEFVSASFEHKDPESVMLSDRLLNVSMSFLRI